VKRVTSGFKEQPGIMSNVIRIMSMMGKNMTEKEKICTITLDEMKTSSRRFYNQKLDKVTGPCQYVQVFKFLFYDFFQLKII
jgi:Transposase protein